MKVRDDKYKAFKAEMGDYISDITPVDLYGHRVNLDKNDPTNLEKTAEDIQEHYGLENVDEEQGESPDEDDTVC